VDKCLERLAGPYYIIPDFRKFMEGLGSAMLGPAMLGPGPASLALGPATLGPAKAHATVEEMQSDLYINSTVFQFYISSVDKPPSKGAGEAIAGEAITDIDNYTELAQIPNWRKKLSNLWLAPFTLDGHKWNTVEHYYQGAKYKRDNPAFYLQFSADSAGELAKDPAMAKGAGGKSGKYNKVQIRPQNIKVDADFFTGRGSKDMEAAQYAKFSQHEDLKRLLLATKKAKLQHFSRGSPPVVFTELMRVRKRLI